MARIRHTNRMHRGEDDSDYSAVHLEYDNGASGLTATNVQDAIDEVADPAADPGNIANPATATAEDVANKLNALMAAMRTAGQLA